MMAPDRVICAEAFRVMTALEVGILIFPSWFAIIIFSGTNFGQ
jgi:hypothetical protein